MIHDIVPDAYLYYCCYICGKYLVKSALSSLVWPVVFLYLKVPSKKQKKWQLSPQEISKSWCFVFTLKNINIFPQVPLFSCRVFSTAKYFSFYYLWRIAGSEELPILTVLVNGNWDAKINFFFQELSLIQHHHIWRRTGRERITDRFSHLKAFFILLLHALYLYAYFKDVKKYKPLVASSDENVMFAVTW